MLIAKPSEPKIFPFERVFFRFFCHTSQHFEFFSNEKTPIFICGAKANFLAISSLIPEDFACL